MCSSCMLGAGERMHLDASWTSLELRSYLLYSSHSTRTLQGSALVYDVLEGEYDVHSSTYVYDVHRYVARRYPQLRNTQYKSVSLGKQYKSTSTRYTSKQSRRRKRSRIKKHDKCVRKSPAVSDLVFRIRCRKEVEGDPADLKLGPAAAPRRLLCWPGDSSCGFSPRPVFGVAIVRNESIRSSTATSKLCGPMGAENTATEGPSPVRQALERSYRSWRTR